VHELTVPKRRVEVEIAFCGGERRRLLLYLAESASDHSGPERVSDVLGRDDRFFPAHDPASDQVVFVARDAVAYASVPRSAEPGDANELTIPTEHVLEITLCDGQRVRGVVGYVLPAERSRLVDFLNHAPSFLRLLASPEELLLVNGRHVARVALAR
jgi:hypothetical protein